MFVPVPILWRGQDQLQGLLVARQQRTQDKRQGGRRCSYFFKILKSLILSFTDLPLRAHESRVFLRVQDLRQRDHQWARGHHLSHGERTRNGSIKHQTIRQESGLRSEAVQKGTQGGSEDPSGTPVNEAELIHGSVDKQRRILLQVKREMSISHVMSVMNRLSYWAIQNCQLIACEIVIKSACGWFATFAFLKFESEWQICYVASDLIFEYVRLCSSKH